MRNSVSAVGGLGVALIVAGRVFAGWESISVQRSIENCAGGFRLSVSEPLDVFGSAVRAGAPCTVMIDGEIVVTGYVDEVNREIDAQQHRVDVTGRDKTADLVDCSALRKTGQWSGQHVERIAADIAAPFGVAVRVDAGVNTGKPLASFALQEGETAFNAIDRATRMRGLLVTTDGAGALLLTRAGTGTINTALELGVNVLSLRVRHDWRNRYSSYTIKGQTAGVHWNGDSAAAKASVAGRASQMLARTTDPAVTRYRPLVLVGDCQDAGGSLHDRVLWEASVRAARAFDVEVEVAGWQHPAGLWTPNRLVRVSAAQLGFEDELLIHRVAFTLDERGSRTVLGLTRRDAYKVIALKEPTVGTAQFTQPKK